VTSSGETSQVLQVSVMTRGILSFYSLAFVVLNQEANQLCFVLSIAEEGRPIFALGQRLSWFSDEDHSPLVT